MTRNCNVISFINMKGGVGKTTLCKEIGFHLANSRDSRVLFIDVDPQANLTQSFFKMFNYTQAKEIITTGKNKKYKQSTASIEKVINSILASPTLYEEGIQDLDKNLSIIPGELGLEFSTRNLNSGKLENGIHDFIKRLNLREQFDYILIDCPPTYSSYTIAALKPSDFYVIPVRPEGYSILGIDMLIQVVNSIVADHELYFENKPLNNLGIVFTNISRAKKVAELQILEQIKTSQVIKKHEIPIIDTYFNKNSQLPKQIDYFIDGSNSTISKKNLTVLTDKILERIDEHGKK